MTVGQVVWVVAQVKTFGVDHFAADWDLGGVFSSQDAARAVCTEPGDAMWPVELDKFLGRETVPAPGASYPRWK